MIAVIGASSATEQDVATAEQVGRLLAENDAVLVCGGGPGVMEAACRGAVNAGGITIGILPGTDPRDCNPYVGVPIATGLGELRNGVIIRASSAVIAIGGGAGTLSEIGFAAKTGKPVFGLHTFEVNLQGVTSDYIKVVDSAEEAVALAMGGKRV
jgi:uncharacterized protein (TIGR00725 family)